MEEHQPPRTDNARKRRTGFIVFGAILLLASIAGFFYWRHARTHVSTDDAFVEGTIYQIASRVPGTVKAVHVRDNQPVRAGDVLVELDPDTFSQRLAGANATLASERALLQELQARREAQKTRISAAKASLERAIVRRTEMEAAVKARQAELHLQEILRDQAASDLKRAEDLLGGQVISREKHEQAKTRFDAGLAAVQSARELKQQATVAAKAQESAIAEARAALSAEEAALVASVAAIRVQEEHIREQEAAVSLARLDLSYTRITAPSAGLVTRKSVELGNRVQEGQPLMNLVSVDDAYVVANFKETRVASIKPGQRVMIRLDAYPQEDFSGRVDSVMSGTGSAFSLFPPENASGNYVKVVQRIPVKIVFDNIAEARQHLRVGMSVVPTVLIED